MMLLTSRRLFKVGVAIVGVVVAVDLLLTVRVYTPRTRSSPLPVGDTAVGSDINIEIEDGDGEVGGNVPFENGHGSGASSTTHHAGPLAGMGNEGGSKTMEKLYVASIHWNDAPVLASHWIPALLNLIRKYGKEDIYISILESGSWDETKSLLRALNSTLKQLGAEHSIILEDETHAEVVNRVPEEEERGWVWGRGRGQKEKRRIPYLAQKRNGAMEPLRKMGRKFEKVVWINDVIFSAEQVIALLNTREGNYAAVCALDFSGPPKFYDSFAVRDSFGLPPVALLWPFFSSSPSRNAILNYSPTQVKSCWNGLVIFDAEPFYEGLQFRGIDDELAEKHVEGSECCLIHADIAAREGDGGKGVWINPNVRVAYNKGAEKAINGEGGWPTGWGKVEGVWWNRWGWVTGWYWRWKDKWVVDGAVREWEAEGEGRKEEGKFCLVDEMQVLVENGWAHI